MTTSAGTGEDRPCKAALRCERCATRCAPSDRDTRCSPRTPTAPSGSSSAPPVGTFQGIPDITFGLLVALGVAVVVASIYLRSIRDALRKRPKVNEPSVLLGREGRMESDMKAGERGVAMVASEEWSVTSAQDLQRGDSIRVKGVAGQTLTVEKVDK